MSLTARILDAEQTRAFIPIMASAFLSDMRPDAQDAEFALLAPERTHGVFDGDTMIGGGSILSRLMTLPGAGPVPVAAVTSVGVAPDQHRRGALTTLMRAQLHGLHEEGGESVAALWASEGGIYGRFGYGVASRMARLVVRRGAPLRADVDPGTDRVVLLDREGAHAAVRKLHGEYRSGRIGGLSRPEASWDWHLSDREEDRGGDGLLRYVVHPAGYAAFRVHENWDSRQGPEHVVRVRELVSVTTQGHATLWRFLLDLDLVGEVRYGNAAMDDPLPFMLENPRQVALDRTDALHVRLVDVDRALPARRYAAPLDVVVELTDGFCPWNAGRWRLTVDADGAARVGRSTAEPDVACGVADLGAAFLGSTRFSVLAAAGRVREYRPGTVRALTVAFAGEHEPHCLEIF